MKKTYLYLALAIAFGAVIGVMMSHFGNANQKGDQGEQLSNSLTPLFELPSMPDPEQSLGPVLDQLLALRQTSSAGKKIELLEQISAQLDHQQHQALVYELVSPRPEGVELEQFAYYFHHICLLLARQADHRTYYGQALMTVVHDAEREAILRDYSLQHLRKLWHYSEDDPGLRKSIVVAFGELISDDTLGSAALLSLHLLDDGKLSAPSGQTLSARHRAEKPHLSNEDLDSYLEKAFAVSSSQELMLTTLRIIRDRGMKEFLPQLRDLCSAENSDSIMVRMASISTLGKLGNAKDLDLIRSLKLHDFRLNRAQQLALSQSD